MCLLVMAYQCHPEFPLIVAANRDEFFSRPTAAADYWTDHPNVLAGRDLEQGGTWMGVNKNGRFAALTNVRDPSSFRSSAKSRGHIVSRFLTGSDTPTDFLDNLASEADDFSVADPIQLNTCVRSMIVSSKGECYNREKNIQT